MASVAGRYASALFDLATEQNEQLEVEAALVRVQAMVDDSADLSRLVKSPVFSAEDQGKALAAVLSKAGISGLTANFLGLIARNRRLFALPDMIEAYRQIAAKSRGEMAAEVISATPLDDTQMSELKASLRMSVGKDVQITPRIDPSLLGGLVVKVGSRMIDGSLRTKLNNLKTRMKEVG